MLRPTEFTILFRYSTAYPIGALRIIPWKGKPNGTWQVGLALWDSFFSVDRPYRRGLRKKDRAKSQSRAARENFYANTEGNEVTYSRRGWERRGERRTNEWRQKEGRCLVRRAFPSSRKLPYSSALSSERQATCSEVSSSKSAVLSDRSVSLRSVPFESPKGARLLSRSRPLLPLHSTKDISSSLEIRTPLVHLARCAPLRVVVNLIKVPSSPTREILLAHYGGRIFVYAKRLHSARSATYFNYTIHRPKSSFIWTLCATRCV